MLGPPMPAPADPPAFPPDDGWCVEVTARGDGSPVERRVFVLAEDARDFARQHVWRNKGHVAEVFERAAGRTVFRTRVEFQT
jgi:hypothetical protein